MLQPLQLKDVSLRYTNEITELRDFLVKADCPVEAVETLGRIAARLPRDRAFHRDLTSHVWVVIDRSDRQISHSDLLGVLAIAAAGTTFAAAAEEDDAHDLLRFLMEARRSLDARPGQREEIPLRWTAEPVANSSTEPFQSAADEERAIVGEPEQLLQRDVQILEVQQNISGGRKRMYWMAAAACVIAALLIGLWLKSRWAPGISNKPASASQVADGNGVSSTVTEKSMSSASPHANEVVGKEGAHSSDRLANPGVTPSNSVARGSHQTSVAARDIPARYAEVQSQPTVAAHGPVSGQAMEAVSIPARMEHSSISSAAPPALRAGGTVTTASVGVPTTALSGRLGVPSAPSNSSEQGSGSAARTSRPPILLHRRPPGASAASSEDGADLVAEVRPADVSAGGTSRTGGTDAPRGGIVRLTSLGSMAANILYSPMPTYPAAASASHVQGEVKISAEVDRDGNVASVRVISGPPMLRDAALDAVQRWRYRPYISSGEPAPMTAIAIMDFQLP